MPTINGAEVNTSEILAKLSSFLLFGVLIAINFLTYQINPFTTAVIILAVLAVCPIFFYLSNRLSPSRGTLSKIFDFAIIIVMYGFLFLAMILIYNYFVISLFRV